MPEPDRKRVSLTNPTWAVLEHASNPLLILLVTPWFLHRLGSELYGNWMLMTAAVAFGAILSTGTSAATIKSVSAAIGRQSIVGIKHAVNASLAVAISGGAILAFLVFLFFKLGASTFLREMGETELVTLTGVAAAALIWLEQVDHAVSSAIKGAEKFREAATVEILSKVLQTTAAAGILLIAPNLQALYLTLGVTAVLRLTAKVALVRRLLAIRPYPSFHRVASILHFAKWGWLQGIGGSLFAVADRVLIGSILGPTALTYYSVASQLAMQVHAIAAAGLSVLFPAVSRSVESRQALQLRKTTGLAAIGNLVVSTLLALVLLFVGPTFLEYWVGPEIAAPTAELLPFLVGAYWLLANNSVFYYTLMGLGGIRFISATVVISGLLGAAAAYIGIKLFGLSGAPLGRATYAAISIAIAIPVLKRVFIGERANAADGAAPHRYHGT